jgi:hypothetical protein
MELNDKTQRSLPNPKKLIARALLAAIVAGAVCGSASLLSLSRFHGNLFGESLRGNLIPAGLLLGLVAMIFVPGYLLARSESRRIERCRRAICQCEFLARWRNAGRETFITRLGVYADGRWILWGTSKLVLKNVQVTLRAGGGTAIMEFTINDGRRDTVEHVLVPASEENLAARIARHLLATPATQVVRTTRARTPVGELRFT